MYELEDPIGEFKSFLERINKMYNSKTLVDAMIRMCDDYRYRSGIRDHFVIRKDGLPPAGNLCGPMVSFYHFLSLMEAGKDGLHE